MDNLSDKNKELKVDSNSSAVDEQLSNPARRRFTRNGIVGSAVVFSLGNRAAWGATVEGTCLSTATWGSFFDNGGTFASAHPATNDPHGGTGDPANITADEMLTELNDPNHLNARQEERGDDTCIVWDEAPPGIMGSSWNNSFLRDTSKTIKPKP